MPVFVDSVLASPSVKVTGIFSCGGIISKNAALKADCSSARWPVGGSSRSRSLIKPFMYLQWVLATPASIDERR